VVSTLGSQRPCRCADYDDNRDINQTTINNTIIDVAVFVELGVHNIPPLPDYIKASRRAAPSRAARRPERARGDQLHW
jgi:hypothetical protein